MSSTGPIATLSPREYDAVLFDMDGVLTQTASIHAAAWKRLFDAFLERRSSASAEPFVPFDIETDYRRYVDGKPRSDGVEAFLRSHAIAGMPRLRRNAAYHRRTADSPSRYRTARRAQRSRSNDVRETHRTVASTRPHVCSRSESARHPYRTEPRRTRGAIVWRSDRCCSYWILVNLRSCSRWSLADASRGRLYELHAFVRLPAAA